MRSIINERTALPTATPPNETMLQKFTREYTDSCRRWLPSENSRVFEALCSGGRRSYTDDDERRRFSSIKDECKHLQAYMQYLMAREHPMLCALYSATVELDTMRHAVSISLKPRFSHEPGAMFRTPQHCYRGTIDRYEMHRDGLLPEYSGAIAAFARDLLHNAERDFAQMAWQVPR